MLKSPKHHILLLSLSTFLAAFSLASIITFTDPVQSTYLTYIFLYLSLFLFSVGFFTLIGISIRQLLFQGIYITNLGHSFRQGILLAVLISGSLILQAEGLLFWWVGLSLVLFLTLLEAFLNLKI